jgi:hypothetical protein
MMLASLISNAQPSHAALACVGAIPGQGAASIFGFGRSAGQLTALAIPVS